MKKEQINIRDPFVLFENDTYYLYGTRAENFGRYTKGFDVYVSKDLENWSGPIQCFDSEKHGLNRQVNWAPEVHKYKSKYYMFATFTMENGFKGTYSLCADSPMGPFVPLGDGPLTPKTWESLDGTLYVDKDGTPYLVFCHECIQIEDGTICYVRLSDNLDHTVGDVVTMFCASSCPFVSPLIINGENYVTDGPFMFRSKTDELFMIWSSFINGKYAELVVKFRDGTLSMNFEHQKPLLDSDGGHGMIFTDGKNTYFTYHTPNKSLSERPQFCSLKDFGDSLEIDN